MTLEIKKQVKKVVYELHLAAFNHCFFKHTLSDLRKGNP